MSEIAFYQYALFGASALISLFIGIIAWFLVQQVGDYREHKAEDIDNHKQLDLAIEQLKLDLIASTRSLDQYKTYVAENFVKHDTMRDAIADMRRVIEEALRDFREEARGQRNDVKDIRKDLQTLITGPR